MAVYKKDGKWYFKGKYKLEDGSWKNYNRIGGKTKKETLEKENNFLLKANEEVIYEKDITFAELKELYFEHKKRKNRISTIIGERGALTSFSKLDNLKINLIRKNTVEKIINKMDNDHLSTSTIRRNITAIKSVFKFALKEKLISNNPLADLENFTRPNEMKKEMECWTYEEFIKFSNSFDDEKLYKYKVYFDFLYYMGTRKGEALALTWEDIDFENNKVRINKTITRRIGGVTIGAPKTNNSYRVIQMPKIIREEMQEFYRYSKQMYNFNNNFYVFYGVKPISNELMFYYFKKQIQKAGVKKIRIHDLRHSHASFLINNGANDKAIADRLGNTITMVREVYSHLFQETEDQLINIIDQNTI